MSIGLYIMLLSVYAIMAQVVEAAVIVELKALQGGDKLRQKYPSIGVSECSVHCHPSDMFLHLSDMVSDDGGYFAV